jgi:hypothetical protein
MESVTKTVNAMQYIKELENAVFKSEFIRISAIDATVFE